MRGIRLHSRIIDKHKWNCILCLTISPSYTNKFILKNDWSISFFTFIKELIFCFIEAFVLPKFAIQLGLLKIYNFTWIRVRTLNWINSSGKLWRRPKVKIFKNKSDLTFIRSSAGNRVRIGFPGTLRHGLQPNISPN